MIAGHRPLCALAAALALAPAWAQDDRSGSYAIAAVSGTAYEYSSGLFETETTHSTGGRVALGWRFGTFALEGWGIDYGSGSIRAGRDRLRAQSLGLSAAWVRELSPTVLGALRVGAATGSERRTDHANGTSVRESRSFATVGIGATVGLTRNLGLELLLDFADQGILSGKVYSFAFGIRLSL